MQGAEHETGILGETREIAVLICANMEVADFSYGLNKC